MSIAIKVENLSKQYRLGQIGTGTFSHDVNRWWYTVRGKEDPYLKIGEANDRSQKGSDYVWALQDISFEIKQGEVVGIIGRNGAGKSTLLKILSKTTAPTKGSIKVNGRIASLLEVGTGFHPELSGRDNIFLNGAILGMTKKEIKSKFDEIVDFSGVERYIDTPVKRYSSGMYVRLAFAVAAHLEPEILIVDEVLAVGDAEFQKKCLGKMKEVSVNDGRTVLFVSHNMAAVSSLTTECIFLNKGDLDFIGDTSSVVKKYLNFFAASAGEYFKSEKILNRPNITRVKVITSEDSNIHENGKDLIVEIDVFMNELIEGMALSFQIFNSNESAVIFAYIFDVDQPILREKGINTMVCKIPNCNLYEDKYYITVHLAESRGRLKFEEIDKICEFEVRIFDKIIEWGWQKNVCIFTPEFEWHNNR
jgi:lipopolysaccharide transport system ATP-binding protein